MTLKYLTKVESGALCPLFLERQMCSFLGDLTNTELYPLMRHENSFEKKCSFVRKYSIGDSGEYVKHVKYMR